MGRSRCRSFIPKKSPLSESYIPPPTRDPTRKRNRKPYALKRLQQSSPPEAHSVDGAANGSSEPQVSGAADKVPSSTSSKTTTAQRQMTSVVDEETAINEPKKKRHRRKPFPASQNPAKMRRYEKFMQKWRTDHQSLPDSTTSNDS